MSRAATAYDRIYAVVRRVPEGKVTTYGAVARIAGLPGRARQVGYALAALRDGTSVPWHRVVNAQGKLSLVRAGSPSGITQRLRLTREGVPVNAGDRVSLAQYGWKPESRSSRTDTGTRARRGVRRS